MIRRANRWLLAIRTGLLAASVVAQAFAAEPGETPKRVLAPRSTPASPLDQPVYPAESRARGHDGIVSLLVMVDVDGSVLDQRVAVSTGHAELDAAALQVTKSWKLQPGTVNGAPTKMWGLFTITFSVDGKPEPTETDQHRAARQLMHEFMEKMEASAASATTPTPE